MTKFVSDQIAANLTMEIRRLQKRKQLHYPPGSVSPPHPSQSTSSTENCPSPSAMDSTCVQTQAQCSSNFQFNVLSPNKKDIPLFTFKQVSMICERMLKERESQIREQYNSVLTCKMAGKLIICSLVVSCIMLMGFLFTNLKFLLIKFESCTNKKHCY